MTKQRKAFRTLAAFAAGLHTANGLAHGIRPTRSSKARNPRARRFEDGEAGGSWV
ncbi:hypothetical protein [Mycolicibacterium sp. P9-22]|jgi:hypothetical protein|uniref:hypothetical protein n=1 Tax=Mycolicibacterium sp. P9-22 TaxID=2024613 RepID=UPI0018840F1B|nr:hypothetical protein [Mycolicibacterium sp. P9-22]